MIEMRDKRSHAEVITHLSSGEFGDVLIKSLQLVKTCAGTDTGS